MSNSDLRGASPILVRRCTNFAATPWRGLTKAACFSAACVTLACGSTSSGADPRASDTTSQAPTLPSGPTTTSEPPTPSPGSTTTPPPATPPATPPVVNPPTTGAPTTSEPPSDTSGAETSSEGGPTVAPTSGETPAPGGGCTVGGWPSADPELPGPFEIVTENEVGPLAGEGEDGEPVAFTVFRPATLGDGGRCHPIVTWGNGTGSNPSLYKALLGHLASHGFIVVASDSPNVASGNPPPMVAGVTWLIEENDNPQSQYFQHIDVAHVGATGHSQGGFASTQAGGDSHVTTIAPLCGASPQRNLHGPALLLCGGADDVVDCDGIANALDASTHPARLANYITADHANWITFRGTTLSPMEVATTAWMRVHLMADTELRPWFYGASCTLCTDDAWEITQKMMDE